MCDKACINEVRRWFQSFFNGELSLEDQKDHRRLFVVNTAQSRVFIEVDLCTTVAQKLDRIRATGKKM